ncbi:hypothetical protein Mapa_009561 [Marchantia paleacea]|nr:hypothetical protein Mapa_009561 [Marchantia paleacea]
MNLLVRYVLLCFDTPLEFEPTSHVCSYNGGRTSYLHASPVYYHLPSKIAKLVNTCIEVREFQAAVFSQLKYGAGCTWSLNHDRHSAGRSFRGSLKVTIGFKCLLEVPVYWGHVVGNHHLSIAKRHPERNGLALELLLEFPVLTPVLLHREPVGFGTFHLQVHHISTSSHIVHEHEVEPWVPVHDKANSSNFHTRHSAITKDLSDVWNLLYMPVTHDP